MGPILSALTDPGSMLGITIFGVGLVVGGAWLAWMAVVSNRKTEAEALADEVENGEWEAIPDADLDARLTALAAEFAAHKTAVADTGAEKLKAIADLKSRVSDLEAKLDGHTVRLNEAVSKVAEHESRLFTAEDAAEKHDERIADIAGRLDAIKSPKEFRARIVPFTQSIDDDVPKPPSDQPPFGKWPA